MIDAYEKKWDSFCQVYKKSHFLAKMSHRVTAKWI